MNNVYSIGEYKHSNWESLYAFQRMGQPEIRDEGQRSQSIISGRMSYGRILFSEKSLIAFYLQEKR